MTTDLEPCVVCAGSGGWARDTGRPMSEPLPDSPKWRVEGWMKCPVCDGSGHWRPQPRAAYP